MQLADRINTHRYLFLASISEPGDNELMLLVEEARASNTTQDVEVGAVTLEARAIESSEETALYELTFSSYVAYAVVNESFDVLDDHATYTGNLLRTYSQSIFLDYVRSATWASDDFPGPITHYGLICLNHIVNVAAVGPPGIRLLRGA